MDRAFPVLRRIQRSCQIALQCERQGQRLAVCAMLAGRRLRHRETLLQPERPVHIPLDQVLAPILHAVVLAMRDRHRRRLKPLAVAKPRSDSRECCYRAFSSTPCGVKSAWNACAWLAMRNTSPTDLCIENAID